MCGIVGYVGYKSVMDILVDGLEQLEYRGYDSSGVAVMCEDEIKVYKAVGKLNNLREELQRHRGEFEKSTMGIGHIRWATHGAPTVLNAHPHTCNCGNLVIVHNGIIENYQELKDKLGTDMRLPHCWYRWGDEVVRYNMPYLTWNHDDPHQTTVMFSGSTLIPVDQDEIIRYTGSYADVFIARYGGNGGVDLAIEEVYSGAPFEFQNDYRALRENLKEVKSNFPISNYVEFVRGLYNKAMSGYPITSFQSTKVQVEQFRKVFEKAMDEGLSVNRLQQISEAF